MTRLKGLPAANGPHAAPERPYTHSDANTQSSDKSPNFLICRASVDVRRLSTIYAPMSNDRSWPFFALADAGSSDAHRWRSLLLWQGRPAR